MTSNGPPENIVDSTKYLGVVINNKLNFKQHIKIMEGEVARSVEILSKLKNCVNKLSINAPKTNIIIIPPAQKKSSNSSPSHDK